MRHYRRCVTLLGVLAFLLAGCAGQSAETQPPTIRYGRDVSEHGMIISDPRFAAAALPERGDAILFDDIGELLKYLQAHPANYRAHYVNDYTTKRWLRAEDARYLLSARINSPMGWGLAACGDDAAARQLQGERGGELLTWAELRSRDWSGRPPGP